MTVSEVVRKPERLIEIKPGEIWEAHGGVHEGLRVQVIKDTGTAVKVRVIRNSGASGGYKMVGQRWSPPRSVFLARYSRVDEENLEKPKVETDLGTLLEKMPPAPVVQTTPPTTGTPEVIFDPVPEPPEKPVVKNSFQNPEVKAKRLAALVARMNALTDKEREDIRRKRVAGTSVFDLAHEYHLDVTSMAKVLSVMEIPNRRSAILADLGKKVAVKPTLSEVARDTINGTISHQLSHLTIETKRQIAADYQAGENYKPLLKKYGLIVGVLAKVLDEMGVERRRPAHHGKTKKVEQVREEEGTVKVEAVMSKYKATVLIMQPTVQTIELNTDSFDSALAMAKAYKGVVRVKSISEA